MHVWTWTIAAQDNDGGLAHTAPGHAEISTHEIAANVRFCPCLAAQPLASERHFVDRQTYTPHRSTALAERQSVTARSPRSPALAVLNGK